MMYNVNEFNNIPKFPTTKDKIYFVNRILNSQIISDSEKKLFIDSYKELLNIGYAVVDNKSKYHKMYLIKYFHFIQCLKQRRNFNKIINYLFTNREIF